MPGAEKRVTSVFSGVGAVDTETHGSRSTAERPVVSEVCVGVGIRIEPPATDKLVVADNTVDGEAAAEDVTTIV